MKKKNELTAREQELLVECRETWRKIGTTAEPSDRPTAEAAISEAYTLLSAKTPEFRWFQSPLAAAKEANKLGSWHSRIYGMTSAFWLARLVFAEQIGVVYTPDQRRCLSIRERIAKSTDMWWPFDGVCLCSERPTRLLWDDRYRLHNPTGPAVEYADGFSVFSWHGTRVKRAWIETKPAAAEVLREPNAEIRRAGCEIIGWDSVIAELGAVTIERDPDPEIGELLEVELPDAGKARFLRVRCGTGRTFVLSVPSEMTTALQANSWSYGLESSEYKLEKRT